MTHVSNPARANKPFVENAFFKHFPAQSKKSRPDLASRRNRYLERWFILKRIACRNRRFESRVTFALTKAFPHFWTLKDHQLALTAEADSCDVATKDGKRRRPLGRVIAPIELMFVYNASVATLEHRERKRGASTQLFRNWINRAESIVALPVRDQYAKARPLAALTRVPHPTKNGPRPQADPRGTGAEKERRVSG